MPTPFYHLRLADDLINHSGMLESTREVLLTWRYEFMLGTISPDVQVLSGQPREETHFFDLPLRPDAPQAWLNMLRSYPRLAEIHKLGPMQVAFLAGYLCHLQADWYWVKDIFLPIFGPRCSWASFSRRLHYHNILRAYLDLQIQPGLPAGLDSGISQVNPVNWLPFTPDRYLKEWRDFVAPQLRSGAAIHTVDVFSSRQGIAPPEYYAVLDSDERMQEEIFSHISITQVQDYHQKILDLNLQLLSDYLALSLHPISSDTQGSLFTGVQP
jgi:hypothetical protein